MRAGTYDTDFIHRYGVELVGSLLDRSSLGLSFISHFSVVAYSSPPLSA